MINKKKYYAKVNVKDIQKSTNCHNKFKKQLFQATIK